MSRDRVHYVPDWMPVFLGLCGRGSGYVTKFIVEVTCKLCRKAINRQLCVCGHVRAWHVDWGDADCADDDLGGCDVLSSVLPPVSLHCPCRKYRRADAAPDRTTDDFLATHPTHHSPERTTRMSKDTDGGEAQQRVRIPLGSPSQPAREVDGSTDRTELRSDATAENRRETQRPEIIEAARCDGLDPHAVGPEGRRCIMAVGHRIRHQDSGGHAWTDQESQTWLDSIADGVREAAGPAVLKQTCTEGCADYPLCPHASLPPGVEPRRCTAPITDDGADGAVVDQCGAILGRDLACELCEGARCYQHCACIDHFPGIQERGYYDGEDKPVWKIRRLADGRYRGQLLRFAGNELRIVATVAGSTGEEVQADLEQRQREMAWETEAITPAAALPAAAPPAVLPFGVLDFVAKAPDKAAGKRAELLEEVIEWLRGCEKEWERLAYDLPETSDRAKSIHDRQIVELFSRLAGAL